MSWFSFDVPWLGALGGLLNKLMKLKLALWTAKALGALGLGFAGKAFVYDPLIDQAVGAWQLVPPLAANWVHALGLDTAISIILSAYGIQGVQRVFLTRANQARDE
ncbi:DUF2523 family protein [Xanthomonas arboricola]|uniref:DUF2523 family protein n=1 Tax=Xanthomonas arboricola TaxID=56448 RepID=UPI0004D3967E|nr:DUF2523 family protein [Xanthomonas arboricola]KER83347.1 hypothetical protein GW16_14960 [Xanthomonas arboricola pv. celebensis]QDS16187.1 DUF2523 domain-containing protein [Xanthomonas arboricola]